MVNISLNISGDSQEVVAVIRALAAGYVPTVASPPDRELTTQSNQSSLTSPTSPPHEYIWTTAAARQTRSDVSTDAQRLLDALSRAPDHQLNIDDIYSQLGLDRYGLIGARRSISAALRRNADTSNVALLFTRDRRVTLDRSYAQALFNETQPNPMSRWGQLT